MTLPAASNQIAFSQINTELGRSANAQISIETAENSGYATIQRCYDPNPPAANPAAVSQWFSYNHANVATLAGYYEYSATSCNDACAIVGSCATFVYSNSIPLGSGDSLFDNNRCTSVYGTGYYARCDIGDPRDCYTVGGSNKITATATCTTTTTTTTTTTQACDCLGGFCGPNCFCPEGNPCFDINNCTGNCI